ncbi:MAG: damage-control phosphatase ARMT1 family protein [Candidatus Zixiibacteriota bacterium]
MKTYLDCFPCFLQQALNAVRFTTDDEHIHERVLAEVINSAASIDPHQTPPEMGQRIHRLIRDLTGNDDPYFEVKERFNRYALNKADEYREKIHHSPRPLNTAVRLAIAGNIIDFGPQSELDDDVVNQAIEEALTQPMDESDFALFEREIERAERILYLGDNAGEIVFDRLLIELLPRDKIIFAVKSRPVINDATRADAEISGLGRLVAIVENGSDAPGTILKQASAEFLKHFNRADMIIAKGQGNYETLSEENQNIFFLLKAKCPVIARHLNVAIGSLVLRRTINYGRS